MLNKPTESPEEFTAAIERALNENDTEIGKKRQNRANDFIADMSWDKTFHEMTTLIKLVITKHTVKEVVAEV